MEEILVTKTDIKIQSKQMQGLKNAVDELILNNEYQLRLKDMNYKEKVRYSIAVCNGTLTYLILTPILL